MKSANRCFKPGADLKVTAVVMNRPLMGNARSGRRKAGSPLARRFRASRTAWLAAALLVVGCCAQAAPNKAAKPSASTNAPSAAVEVEIPQSVFVIAASAREGRNPFFPRSNAVQPSVKPKTAVADTTAIVLNGITSQPRASVMINGITFEKGEEHEVRLPGGGKVRVRCDDIRQDSALVMVNGLERELRMRSGL